MTLNRPDDLLGLLVVADTCGWSYREITGKDSSGYPWVALEAWRIPSPTRSVRVTWHSQTTMGETLDLYSAVWISDPRAGAGQATDIGTIRALIMANPVEAAARDAATQ